MCSSMSREVPFKTADFDLFGQDISPADYEFFKKHTGAFKRLLQDQSKEKKQEFVDAFKDFSLHHGCLKDCPTKNDSRLSYLEEAALVYKESFVNGKFSSAKNLVMDAVTLAQNKHLLQYMGAKSYSKDPFSNKETRDVFRRLFGPPSLNGTFIKVICVLPLHIKFGGSICRYLRRWLDTEPPRYVPPLTTEPKKSKSELNSASGVKSTSKKKEKEAKLKEEQKNREEILKFETYIREVFKSDTDGRDGMAQVRAALESINYPGFTKSETTTSVPEEKPPKKTEDESKKPTETPRDEGLSLSDYLGVSNNKDNEAKGKSDFSYPTGRTVYPIAADQKMRYAEMMANIKSEDFFKPVAVSLERTPDGGVNIVTEPVPEGEYKSPLDCVDGSFEELEKMFLLNKPHPNEQFEQSLLGKKLSKEDELKLKQCKENFKQYRAQHEMKKTSQEKSTVSEETPAKVKKRHACANCRKVEPEPKTFKKCQRCRGKRTRFYCSRSCQETDWVISHREDHNSIEDVT